MKKKEKKILPPEVMKRCVLYLRFSSENQTEQSIEGQRAGCQEYAKNHGLTIIGEYVDRAKTGTNDDRADFQRMISDSYSGQFGNVLYWKSDRFARQRYDANKYRTILDANGVKTLSATEANLEGPERIMMESVSDGWNEYYSAELSVKVKRGLRESVKKGNFIGGYRPLGYSIVDGKYVVNEEEAIAVKEIFRLYAYEGKNMSEIARILKANGMKWSDGREISHQVIEKAILAERYIGVLKCDGERNENAIPRLISDETWERAQQRREKKKHKGGAFRADVEYALAGKLFCGECGCPFVGQSGTSKNKRLYSYYTCNGRIHHECKAPRWKKEDVETYAIRAIQDILSENENSKYVADYLYKAQANDTVEASSIKRSLDDVNRRIANIEKAIEAGIFTKTTQGALLKLEAEKEGLETQMAKENLRHRIYTKEEIRAALEEFCEIDISRDVDRKAFVSTFISKVLLYKDGRMIVTANVFGKKVEADIPLEELKSVRMENVPPRQFKTSEPHSFKGMRLFQSGDCLHKKKTTQLKE